MRTRERDALIFLCIVLFLAIFWTFVRGDEPAPNDYTSTQTVTGIVDYHGAVWNVAPETRAHCLEVADGVTGFSNLTLNCRCDSTCRVLGVPDDAKDRPLDDPPDAPTDTGGHAVVIRHGGVTLDHLTVTNDYGDALAFYVTEANPRPVFVRNSSFTGSRNTIAPLCGGSLESKQPLKILFVNCDFYITAVGQLWSPRLLVDVEPPNNKCRVPEVAFSGCRFHGVNRAVDAIAVATIRGVGDGGVKAINCAFDGFDPRGYVTDDKGTVRPAFPFRVRNPRTEGVSWLEWTDPTYKVSIRVGGK